MSNVIHIDKLKGKEVFWYEDMPGWKIVIGIRGLGEFRIDKWDAMRAEDSFTMREGRHWSIEEALKWAINYARRESEYVEFEEVKPDVKLLR